MTLTLMSTRAVTPRSRKDRDAGLLRIKQLTRWSLAGALAGTGLFAGLATRTTIHSTNAATKAVQTNSPNTSGSSSSASDDSSSDDSSSATPATTTPMTSAPVATSSPAIVTSGAS